MPRDPNRSDKIPESRPGHQEAGRHRQHEDARPQRRLVVGVAVQRQPDALQPDDQHELDAAARDRHQQAGHVARGELADLEQRQPEHRLGDPGLDDHEDDQQGDAADELAEHDRGLPAHRVVPVGLDAVGDADEDRAEAEGERDVAPPVDLAAPPHAVVAQLQVGPQRAEDADRAG